MDCILYLLLFCMGTVFGSFFTLAVYRIPLKQDITHTRSYCPNCNHKLSFWDMIPIFSYIFLGGKCKYCKQKIRPRYLMLEILTGIVFVLFALSFKFNILHILIRDAQVLAYFVTGLIYIATIFIVAGIDKENIKVEKPVILVGFICIMFYIIYLYIIGIETSMYRYVIYLIIFCIFTVLDSIYLRKKTKTSYPIDVILLLILMLMFTYEVVCIYTVIITLLSIATHLSLKKVFDKKNKFVKIDMERKIPIAFYMCIANISTLLITNFYIFYCIGK